MKKKAENKVIKQWKEISKQMSKAVNDRNKRLKHQKLLCSEFVVLLYIFLLACIKSTIELLLSLNYSALLGSAVFFQGRLVSFEVAGTLARLSLSVSGAAPKRSG
ncbi:hypothetical protein L873DRAFT_1815346 [Choiromyces venosus 120613-1]|uniref:Uncharacterized protein n=1 Tax=Choiromyces venosus 120613-1 TaxID=1336337 RepID=A0A3N4JBL5_9PEZI|nr:hypothetical protein L873DRAFT_1815346 [Choiromyces venosus 120613-1]